MTKKNITSRFSVPASNTCETMHCMIWWCAFSLLMSISHVHVSYIRASNLSLATRFLLSLRNTFTFTYRAQLKAIFLPSLQLPLSLTNLGFCFYESLLLALLHHLYLASIFSSSTHFYLNSFNQASLNNPTTMPPKNALSARDVEVLAAAFHCLKTPPEVSFPFIIHFTYPNPPPLPSGFNFLTFLILCSSFCVLGFGLES